MNKEIKIKVIKLFIRFLKEKEFYNKIIKQIKKNQLNINDIIEKVTKINISYFEGYAKIILFEMGYSLFNNEITKIEEEWIIYCKTNLLKYNIDDIWEMFKQTKEYEENEHLIQKYDKENIKKYECSEFIQTEYKNLNCVAIHVAYVNDIINLLAKSINIDFIKYQQTCENMPSYNLLKKWETFYENNVELKY